MDMVSRVEKQTVPSIRSSSSDSINSRVTVIDSQDENDDKHLDSAVAMKSSSSPSNHKPKRKNSKRPSRNPVYMPSLRILRRDIRRTYGQMLMNVVNSQNSFFMKRFFQEYSVPHIESTDQLPDNLSLKILRPPDGARSGVDEIVDSILINFLIMPDMVVTMTNMKVCKRSDAAGSRIIAHVQMRGTMLFAELDKIDTDSELSSDEVSDSKSHEKSGSPMNGAIPTDLLGPLKSLLQPTSKPFEYLVECNLIIKLDELHRFVSIKIDYCAAQERNLNVGSINN